ncbi:CapA family protein [Metabacillus sp. HB246100]
MKKVIVYIAIFIVILSSISFYVNSQQTKNTESRILKKGVENKPPSSQIEDMPKPLQKQEQKEEKHTTSATLAAIGDILIHDRVYEPAELENGEYDFMPYVREVQQLTESSDLTIANQETVIGGKEVGLSSYPSFNSPFEVGDTLKEIGIDVVTLANNHTLDRGEKAIKSGISHWNELNMVYTGSYESTDDRNKIRIIDKNDISFAFLAYTYGTNGITPPKDKPYLVNYIEEETIRNDIKEAKKNADVVVVSLHFGKEYERMPNDFQKNVVAYTANAGADIIIGHHPHVLQPMEWFESENGERTFVAYSLGNFLSGQTEDFRDIGGIMQLTVEKTLENDREIISIKNPVFVPTYVNENYFVSPLETEPDMQKLYKEIKSHMNQWLPELQFSLH